MHSGAGSLCQPLANVAGMYQQESIDGLEMRGEGVGSICFEVVLGVSLAWDFFTACCPM